MWVEQFLEDLDRSWRPVGPGEGKLVLRVIGSTALMLQSDYRRGTNDGDILRTSEITDEVRDQLLALGGPDTPLHHRHRVYIQVVASGMLFKRQSVQWQHLSSVDLKHFDVEMMSILDVAVSKLIRLHANDRLDLEAMAERNLLSHEALVSCFCEAVESFLMDARAPEKLPLCRKHLHQVERDVFGVTTPTTIEFPSWIEDE